MGARRRRDRRQSPARGLGKSHGVPTPRTPHRKEQQKVVTQIPFGMPQDYEPASDADRESELDLALAAELAPVSATTLDPAKSRDMANTATFVRFFPFFVIVVA